MANSRANGGVPQGPPEAPAAAWRDRLSGPWRSLSRLSAPRWASGLLRARPPTLAVSFGRDRFTLVQVRPPDKDGRPVLAHVSVHPLPGGSVTPTLMTANVSSPGDLAARLGRALEAVPGRRKLHRVAVVLPDCCARVTLLTLRDAPASRRQAEELLRWQIRKRVPFRLEDARLVFQRFPLPDALERVVVTLALESVIAPYEQVLESLGLHAGLVDLATFNLANLAALTGGGATGDLVVVHAAAEDLSLLVFRDGVPLFYRSKELVHEPEREPEAARRELTRELTTSIAYYRDRLGGGAVGRVVVSGMRAEAVPFVRLIREHLGVEAAPLDVTAVVTPRPGLGDDMAALVSSVAPAVGLVLGRSVA